MLSSTSIRMSLGMPVACAETVTAWERSYKAVESESLALLAL